MHWNVQILTKGNQARRFYVLKTYLQTILLKYARFSCFRRSREKYPQAASRNLIGVHGTCHVPLVGVDSSRVFFSRGDHPKLPSFMHPPVLIGKYSSSTLAALTPLKLFVKLQKLSENKFFQKKTIVQESGVKSILIFDMEC